MPSTVIIILIVVLMVALLVVPMFTNRKRQKEANEMLSGIEVGDEIMTLGGIMGTVVALSTHESGEKLMTIETGEGDNKSQMTFTVQALRLNYTKVKLRQERLAQEKAEKEAAKLAAKDKDNQAEVKAEEATEEATQETESVANEQGETKQD